jgi:hypothetical protein
MIFVEFRNIEDDDDQLTVGRKFTVNFENFYRINSRGKLNFEADILSNYFLINQDSSVYGMDSGSQGDPIKFFADGIRTADRDANFADEDFVVAMPPVGIKKIFNGPDPRGNRAGLDWVELSRGQIRVF